MSKKEYVARMPDNLGNVFYDEEENQVWAELYHRQLLVIKDRACDEFVAGISALKLCPDRIPQVPEVSAILSKITGWSVAPVKALISFQEFFTLLSLRQFPAATFIRRKEELDYLKEPDIFHEIFGHCPLLTHKAFADFTHRVGVLGLDMNKKEQSMLARLYWFTVEFGLIAKKQGLRIYGGGILSSKNETIYSLESDIPKRHAFDLITVLRTQYRYDEMQKNYFIINSFDELFSLVDRDLQGEFSKAMALGVITESSSDMRSC